MSVTEMRPEGEARRTGLPTLMGWPSPFCLFGSPCLHFTQKVNQKTEVQAFSGESLREALKRGDLEKDSTASALKHVVGVYCFCVVLRLKTLRLNHRILGSRVCNRLPLKGTDCAVSGKSKVSCAEEGVANAASFSTLSRKWRSATAQIFPQSSSLVSNSFLETPALPGIIHW